MQTAKLKTNWKKRPSDNLKSHIYSEIIPRPNWRYIGAPRLNPNGSMVDERSFSLKQMSTPGRAFQWTIHDQAWAVGEGFFLHRSGFANRVNIVWIDRFRHDTDDGRASIEKLQRGELSDQCRPREQRMYARALRFIKQQDEFGYSGAWDQRVQFFSNQMTWYRAYCVEHKNVWHLSPREHEIKRKAEASRERAREARRHSFAQHIVRRYITK